jgi:L-aspartate oxidase
VSTGDGVALALRAGAAVTDIEFVQFHPTALATVDGTHAERQPLISEALRGEGAHLVDGDGKRFMVGQHPLAELAPRDVVAKAIHRVLLAAAAEHVYLDARHLPDVAGRFPTITAACRAAGIDPVTELIPVAPAAHYASGGIRTDLFGRSSIPGLYACGEAACTGVHGANRLASNSLLEGLVFSRRIAEHIAETGAAVVGEPITDDSAKRWVVDDAVRSAVQRSMTRGAGVLRSADSLAATATVLAEAGGSRSRPGTATWEATNLVTVAAALVAAAGRREETRGNHWREDFPEARPEWLGHLIARIDDDGRIDEAWEPR